MNKKTKDILWYLFSNSITTNYYPLSINSGAATLKAVRELQKIGIIQIILSNTKMLGICQISAAKEAKENGYKMAFIDENLIIKEEYTYKVIEGV